MFPCRQKVETHWINSNKPLAAITKEVLCDCHHNIFFPTVGCHAGGRYRHPVVRDQHHLRDCFDLITESLAAEGTACVFETHPCFCPQRWIQIGALDGDQPVDRFPHTRLLRGSPWPLWVFEGLLCFLCLYGCPPELVDPDPVADLCSGPQACSLWPRLVHTLIGTNVKLVLCSSPDISASD